MTEAAPRSSRYLRWLILALIGLASLQVLCWVHHREPVIRAVLLVTGERFPLEYMPLSESSPLPLEGQCSVAYVCTVDCPACHRLAESLQGPGEDSLGLPTVWIIVGAIIETERFASEHGIPPEKVALIDISRPRPVIPDIPGTPTRLVIDSAGIIRQISFPGDFSDQEWSSSICEAGA